MSDKKRIDDLVKKLNDILLKNPVSLPRTNQHDKTEGTTVSTLPIDAMQEKDFYKQLLLILLAGVHGVGDITRQTIQENIKQFDAPEINSKIGHATFRECIRILGLLLDAF